MPLTFVHTADWHFGCVYHGIGPRAGESARWRVEAVRRLFEVATQNDAAFILVAGDVFHTDTPAQHVMREAVNLLRDAPVPVILISGNHDPCAEGSVWHHHQFRDALQGVKNVHCALQAEPVRLDSLDTLIYPCPVTEKHTRADTTAWIPDGKRGSGTRIGLAHGHWRGYSAAEGGYNMIDAECADRCGLDYLALGDFHSYTLPDHPAAKRRTYYAGTPEVSATDDQRAGHVLVVTLDAPGAEPTVQPHTVGRARVVDWGEVVLAPGTAIDELQQRTARLEDADNVLLRARLRGCVTQNEMAELDRWANEVREQLLGADIRTSGVFTEPSETDFAALRLEPSEQRLLDHLAEPLGMENLGGVEGGERIAAWSDDAEARRAARSLYYQLLRESVA